MGRNIEGLDQPVGILMIPRRVVRCDVFEKNDFLTYTINSVIVSFSATGLALLLGVPAGYGIAKAKATKAAALILIARVTPGLSYLIPLFLMFQWLGMIGTLTPLVITHLVITVPIVAWVMIGFFEGLPGELEEAALVDGATIQERPIWADGTGSQALVEGPLKLIVNGEGRAAKIPAWKNLGPVELYDLANDPGERPRLCHPAGRMT